jgi:hypothetical protein
LTVDGKEHVLGPGGSFVVQPGVRHLPRNAGADELRFRAEMRPAGRFEEFLAENTAVNNAGHEGLAYLLCAARVIHRFPDVEHPTQLPRPLEGAMFTMLAGISTVFGLRIPSTSDGAPASGGLSGGPADDR